MPFEIPLPDGGTFALPLPEETKDMSLQSLETLIERLTDNGKHRIAVEFECGACCKKVSNGAKLIVIPILNVLVLLPSSDDSLLLKFFCDGCLVEKEKIKAIIIRLDNVKAIEIGAAQEDR